MTQDFGDEFVNISQFVAVSSNPARDTRSGDAFDLARTMATQLASSLDFPVFRPSSSPAPRGIVFYLPPGRYLLPRLPPRPNDSPDGHTVYELPANVQLYVCIGALIRPDEGVDLVIRGSIRAGLYQIFGYDRYKPRTPERVGLNHAYRVATQGKLSGIVVKRAPNAAPRQSPGAA